MPRASRTWCTPCRSAPTASGVDGYADKPSEVKLWDTKTGGERLAFRGHSGKITSLAFRPDGKQIATASYDATIKLWDAVDGREQRTLQENPIFGLSLKW